jgi:hypothetical protein
MVKYVWNELSYSLLGIHSLQHSNNSSFINNNVFCFHFSSLFEGPGVRSASAIEVRRILNEFH